MKPASRKPEGWEIPFRPGALVILPPDRVRYRIDRLRRKYDPAMAQRIPAHITVCQPFRFEPDHEAFRRVRGVLARFEPFTVSFGPLRTFLPYPCIWYEVQPVERLLELRRALHATGLFNTDLPRADDFIPHMSITDGSPDPEETLVLLKRLAPKVKAGRFPVKELVFMRPDWQMRFRTVALLSLGRPALEGIAP